MAIWMVEYPTFSYLFSSVGPATSALATTYYHYAIAGTGTWNPVFAVNWLTSSLGVNKNQDMGYIDLGLYRPESFPTPLPSTWTMLIAGFAGFGYFAYRGSKKNSSALAAA